MTTEEQLKEIVELLQDIIKTNDIDLKAHEEEHEFLRHLIEKAQKEEESWAGVRQRIVEGSIWSLIVGIVIACAYTAKALCIHC
jgi:hypothetical protein